MKKEIKTPLSKEMVKTLKAGDVVLLTGEIYTARDAAHKRMIQQLEQNKQLPFNIQNQVLYYVGPTPAKENMVIGSAGPTTSYRMDSYTPILLEQGLIGMIGKGERNQAVVEAMKKNGAVYFAAVGGAGALLSAHIIDCQCIAYGDLGPEAIHKLTIKDFPLVVAIDSEGNNLYEIEKSKYRYANKEV